MTHEKSEAIDDCLGDFGFRVRYRYTATWCDVEAFEFVARFEDGHGEFNKKDYVVSPDPVRALDDAQPYITGFIKWDGCSEFDWKETHLCGPDGFRRHFALLECMYRKSQKLMGRADAPWDDVKFNGLKPEVVIWGEMPTDEQAGN